MLNAERCAAWIAEAEKLRPARDAANNLLSEHVPKLARQLVEYLQTIKTTAEAVSNLNVQAPPGYHLDAVDPAKLIAKFVVPSMQQGGKQLWPVRTFDPSLFAPVGDRGLSFPGGDWWKASQERNRQLLARAEEANK